MPVIKSAKKKLRQDKKRQLVNKKIKNTYKSVLKQARENPTVKTVQNAFSALDKAARKGIIHANKAARLKAALAKAPATKKTTPSEAAKKKTPKKTPKKTTPKK